MSQGFVDPSSIRYSHRMKISNFVFSLIFWRWSCSKQFNDHIFFLSYLFWSVVYAYRTLQWLMMKHCRGSYYDGERLRTSSISYEMWIIPTRFFSPLYWTKAIQLMHFCTLLVQLQGANPWHVRADGLLPLILTTLAVSAPVPIKLQDKSLDRIEQQIVLLISYVRYATSPKYLDLFPWFIVGTKQLIFLYFPISPLAGASK